MSAPTTIHVRLAERSYDIEIGSDNLAGIGELVASARPSRVVVISDRHVEQLFASQVMTALEAEHVAVALEVVEPGEASKSVQQAERLWQALLKHGADRQAVIVALGGGVVGDLAGFVAATFARGIRLVQVPTTLLAQVDSSVGGKVGVNLPTAKNMVGAFWQPFAVLIDTDVLRTLPDREYRAGLAEVVKYGVILDADLFAFLEANVAPIDARDSEALRHIVTRCCQLKADVVADDERETTGRRAVLNYGHTFCHALEAVTGYSRYLHGEAVAIGMLCASRLAESLGRVPSVVTERQANLLARLGLPLAAGGVDPQRLLEAMQRDKKTERGRLRFVLPNRIGAVELVDGIPANKVLAACAGPEA